MYWCQDVPGILRRYQQHEEDVSAHRCACAVLIDESFQRIRATKGIVEKLGHAFLFKPPVYQSSAEALIRATDAISEVSRATGATLAAC